MRFYRKLTIQRLMVVILFILLFVMAVRVPTDTDTWWHIRSGEYIVENQAIPKTDPFSHTRYGKDWIDQLGIPDRIQDFTNCSAGDANRATAATSGWRCIRRGWRRSAWRLYT
jgi:hypothetical protein